MIVYVSVTQGLYFLLTGVWALADIRSFQKVTGPKTDLWLVKTVGVIVSVIGLTLIVAGFRGQVTLEIFILALGSAAALAGIDINYVAKRVISPIYLADAAAEAILIIWWTLYWFNVL